MIIGAGGQARELAWYVTECNKQGDDFDVVGFVVTDLSRLGPRDSAERVLGDYDWLRRNRPSFDGLALGIGTPSARLEVAGVLRNEFPEVEWPNVVHPTACVDRVTASFGRGIMIGAGVVATVNLKMDDFSMLNFGVTVGHEARIGEGAVVNPGANISGGVTVGRGVLVGAGAVVLQQCSIGTGAIVGAGAVVTKNVPPETTVIGVPARPTARHS